MKFNTYDDYLFHERSVNLWRQTADKLSMIYGIQITVETDYGGGVAPKGIFFRIDDKEFESLKDLRKALKMKAFI
jgi:hypothetical protein